jgi:hypothetical protein
MRQRCITNSHITYTTHIIYKYKQNAETEKDKGQQDKRWSDVVAARSREARNASAGALAIATANAEPGRGSEHRGSVTKSQRSERGEEGDCLERTFYARRSAERSQEREKRQEADNRFSEDALFKEKREGVREWIEKPREVEPAREQTERVSKQTHAEQW